MAGVYIHIPYCEGKCHYCNFYSLGGNKNVPDEYISAIVRDIKSTAITAPVETVYFGGGTPSLMSAQQVATILSALNIENDAEITLEANPGTVDFNLLCEFKKQGVNRLSLGIQTALNSSLKHINRFHTTQQSKEILQMATKAGFENISADLMLCLPNYTLQEMLDTINLIKDCTHISAYILKIEPNTYFSKFSPDNLPSEDNAAEFYLQCIKELKRHNFLQYEISNFAKENCESRHNLLYWNCEDYYSFGPSSHNCVNGKRYSVPKGVGQYIKAAQPPVFEGHADYNDYIMLQLRLNKGLNFSALKARYNIEFTGNQFAFCKKLHENQLAILTDTALKLTPQGMLLQNSILSELL